MKTFIITELVFLCRFLLVISPVQAQQKEPAAAGSFQSPGEVHGRITLSSTGLAQSDHQHDPLRAIYGGRGAERSESSSKRGERRYPRLSERAVVYLESKALSARDYPIPEKHPILDQRGLQFHPQVLPILVGTPVDFPNRDNLFHNVFSYSKPKSFDLGRYPKDDSRSVTFDTPGVVRVYCDIHSHMNATILVLGNPYFATPDDEGRYSIRNVPDGKYTLTFWCDRDVVESRTIEVRAGQSLQVDFAR